MAIVLFLLVVVAAGLGGYAALGRLGLDEEEAWAGARPVGLVAVCLPGWWWGSVGLPGWRWLSLAVLAGGAVLGGMRLWQHRASWRRWLSAEAVVTSFALVVLVLRLPHPDILGTEKPMDLGILATLLRAEAFPPPDMWLAGESLPYYYWGALPWSFTAWLAQAPLELAYNLVAALLAGLVAGLVWAIARRLGGRWWHGLLAAFVAVLAGTPDGLRQVAAGLDPGRVELWSSSRQVESTITEYPLFTFWLGDLHPHLLSIPFALASLLLALVAARRGLSRWHLGGLAALVGVTWAANPWAMPPTVAAVALLLVCGDGLWRWPWASAGRRRWLAAAVVPVGGWIVAAPFHLRFDPPFRGVDLVHAWTPPIDLLLYGGALLVPVGIAAFRGLSAATGGGERGAALALATLAIATVLGAVAARPTALLLGVVFLILVVLTVIRGEEERATRPALALAALGVYLFLIPELVYVVDSYGSELHRMNTVFKAYLQGWTVLALALPALLGVAAATRGGRAVLVLLIAAASLPHLARVSSDVIRADACGLDGLAWMEASDRALVEVLREEPPGTTLIEAVGGPYSLYARLSAASGVPAYLGWGNHELVWRGGEAGDEIRRRTELVEKVYNASGTARVRELVADAGVDLVAIGSLERSETPAATLDVIRAAGDEVVRRGGGELVRFSAGGER